MNALIAKPNNMTSKQPYTTDDSRWSAVVARDKAADGQFYYAISTTGIYCHPSCPSRQALRENTRYFTTGSEAERAGFRPCLRCKPDHATQAVRDATMIAEACRMIGSAETIPSLDNLAQAQGMSSSHFHRLFKSITGLTPRAYAIAQRAQKVKDTLCLDKSITDTIYDAGFNSSGRFYATTAEILGMTPTQFKSGGQQETIHFAIGQCSFGSVLVARSSQGVCAILINEDPQFLIDDLQQRFPKATLIGDDRDFENWVAHVVGFIEQPALGLELPLDIRGTAFQQRVWQALRKIPIGTTASYTDIATQLGDPKAVRAVARACAANPIAIAVPCHRVVRNDGGISGYRWGVENKRTLIAREAAQCPH